MKCNNCGAKSENESFCNYCGTLFEASINEKAWSNTTEKNDQLTNYLVLALSAQETSNYPEEDTRGIELKDYGKGKHCVLRLKDRRLLSLNLIFIKVKMVSLGNCWAKT